MIALNGTSQLQGGSGLDFFLFLSPLFSFLNEMSCWISEQCDVLAGVAELVLRLTIAEEKIELSVPISSPARVCVCVCVYTDCGFFGLLLVCVSVHAAVFMSTSSLFPCVLQRRTQLWHSNIPRVEWPTCRGPQWVSRLTGLVVCCLVRERVHCKKSRMCLSVCLCASL